ncbi:MAG: hypothetical protein ACFFCM_21990, partial [Promethearchaeota archaeon]
MPKITDPNEKNAIKELKKQYKLKDKEFKIDENGFVNIIKLSNKNIHQIPEQIKALPHLKKLILDYNQIKKMTGFDNLTELLSLNLGNNQITRIEGLSELKALKILDL